MEYCSSEDDELIEDFADLEDDPTPPDADQAGGGAASSQGHFVDRDAGGTDVIATDVDVDVKNQDPYLRMEFESDAAARAFYNAYASRLGFGIRVARSRSERRKGVEVLVMKRFVCLKEGHHKKKATDLSARKKRKRLSIRDGCPAMMEVVRRAPDRWVVTKLVLDHTHVVVSPDKVREIQLRRLSGKYREHENYLKEMRLRMFGDGDAQVLLDYFKKMQAENPGFFYAIQVDGRNCMANANENMTMPFAAFTGVNHHGQPVVFGCALVVDKTELGLPRCLEGTRFRSLPIKAKLWERQWQRCFLRLITGYVVHFQTFIAKFDQEMDSRYAEEAQMDNTVFAFSGILCRHVLGVFVLAGVILLPDHCISRRWTKKAKIGPEPDGLSADAFKVAKDMLRKAFAEIASFEEKLAKSGQHQVKNT
ncbi:Protein FAR1-RELATED SEQUENCE 5 [Ananas comosus]|uniref:Protein FAR1-RELATED SEQUENCE n=1 Tax=Ananas comosus TaxID=4615 RepID=A0A199W0Y2_ANACO|nr:Protein FAR1-RELATED SEQUENCE 5 [Ananas comosus]